MRVLDLSRYRPGPFATMLLADMGAEVLKIEGPDGDDMQHLGPRDAVGQPIFCPSLNGGKKVRRMDLKDAAVREEFLRLVESADAGSQWRLRRLRAMRPCSHRLKPCRAATAECAHVLCARSAT